MEAAWADRHRPGVGGALRKRQERVREEVQEIVWETQHRLPARYRKLTEQGKNKGLVVIALDRELLGFIWAIAIQVKAGNKEPRQRAA